MPIRINSDEGDTPPIKPNTNQDIMFTYIRQVAQTIIEYAERQQEKLVASVPTN